MQAAVNPDETPEVARAPRPLRGCPVRCVRYFGTAGVFLWFACELRSRRFATEFSEAVAGGDAHRLSYNTCRRFRPAGVGALGWSLVAFGMQLPMMQLHQQTISAATILGGPLPIALGIAFLWKRRQVSQHLKMLRAIRTRRTAP
jgi:hypothetical protein